MRKLKAEGSGQKMREEKQVLSEDEVRHIAKLANLSLTNEEVKKIWGQLSEALDYIGVLNELNTKEVVPTSQISCLENIAREDKTRPSLSQKEALSGSSTELNGFFKTKGVLKSEFK